MLNNEVGYFISWMNLALNSFLTSSTMECSFSPPLFYFLWAIAFRFGSMDNWWHMMSEAILDISDGFHENKSTFCLNMWTISNSSSGVILKPICVVYNSSSLIYTFFMSPMQVKLFGAGSSLGSRSTKLTFNQLTSLGRSSSIFFFILKLFL